MPDGVGWQVPLAHRDPVARLQHCASLVQFAPSAEQALGVVATQWDCGGLASGGGSSWQAAVAGDAVAPQQSRLLVQMFADVRGPGPSQAASEKNARELPARSS